MHDLVKRICRKPGYKIAFVLGLVVLAQSIDYQADVAQLAAKEPVVIPPTVQEVKLAGYFKAKGSAAPDRMAHAVCQTSVPRLMAAVAVVESGGSVHAVNKQSKAKGAFQVKEKHWGKVALHPGAEVPQALQSERILAELLDEKGGSLPRALNAYGGDTKGRYSRVILAELQGVPR